MTVEQTPAGANLYRNNQKAISIGNQFWDDSERLGLAGIVADLVDGKFVTRDGHEFINFSCCSYLDLDSHPAIIDGAVSALKRFGVLDHCISRIRLQMPALLELEENLSALFESTVVSAISAGAATAGILPLLSSGHFSRDQRPVMIFDKQCHFSMNLYKPVCADETHVLTCRHNDINFIEDACRRFQTVAYVCDGTYSMGGHAPVEDLLYLQDKYGLILYFDDSHSLSIHGPRGQGYVRSSIREMNDRTIIVATLNKAFGTSGGIVMLGPHDHKTLKILERFGGPLAWSQPMNTAAIGASIASAEIHRSGELRVLQGKLLENIKLFDDHIKTEQHGLEFPIKLVSVPNEDVVRFAQHLYRQGFYVSPVFFPIVAQDKGGLRVMLRAGQKSSEVLRLCNLISELQELDAPREQSSGGEFSLAGQN